MYIPINYFVLFVVLLIWILLGICMAIKWINSSMVGNKGNKTLIFINGIIYAPIIFVLAIMLFVFINKWE